MSRFNEKLQIVIVKWFDEDGIAEPIGNELVSLGYKVTYIFNYERIPENTGLVFSFAPYGRFFPIQFNLSKLPVNKRPLFIHWNFESLPNHRIPWKIVKFLSSLRSGIDRLNESERLFVQYIIKKPPLSVINRYMHKYRYIGEYQYAYKMGFLNQIFVTSRIHSQLYSQSGLPVEYIPWGTSPCWFSDLNLNRDIDVLWMGKRRTDRRHKLIDKICSELYARGFNMYIADNEINPFIYDDVRTQFLNRAKITLGISPSWYDTSYVFKINLASANKSLFISETVLPHAPEFVPDKHFVLTPIEKMVDTLVYYLTHEEKRKEIVEPAYQLVTTDLTLRNSIKKIMKSLHTQYDKM